MIVPLISVITPTFNGGKYLKSTIESIINQTYQNFELIVVVDGSRDNTIDILNSIEDKRLKYFINDTNKGISYSTNKCFAEAKGEYIVICDHDDISLPNRFQTQLNFLLTNKGIDGCFGVEKRINKDVMDVLVTESDIPRIQEFGNFNQVFARQIFGHVINNPAAMFRKRILDNMDMWFDENVKVSADLDFYERAFLFGADKWVGLENILIEYRVHEASASKSKKDIAKKESLKIPLLSIRRIYPAINERELFFHKAYIQRDEFIPINDQESLYLWFQKLIKLGEENNNIDKLVWLKEIERHWVVATSLLYNLNPFAAYRYYCKLHDIGNLKRSFLQYCLKWQKITTNYFIKKAKSKYKNI